MPERAADDVLRPVQVGVQAFERLIEDREDAHRGGQVIDGVRMANELIHQGLVENRTLDELK